LRSLRRVTSEKLAERMILNAKYEHLAYSPNPTYIFSKVYLKSGEEIGKICRIEKAVAVQLVAEHKVAGEFGIVQGTKI